MKTGTSSRRFKLTNNTTSTMAATKEKEQALPATRSYGDPVDLTHLGGHAEMRVTEIHHGDTEGPVNKDDGFVIVMQDQVGNKRVGRISRRQLRLTIREIGWEVEDY